MTFLAPIYLVAGLAAASAIILLHFLARRRPRPSVLPTARFVPDRPARWPSRAPRPTDWLLLALRVLAIVTIAAAFAQPIRKPERAVSARVVLVDRSRDVADAGAARDSARALLREGDALVAFDTIARVIPGDVLDSIASLTSSGAPASLSAALITAERIAATMRGRADSLELVIISPFSADAWDYATSLIRGRWPGRARLVMTALRRGDSSRRSIEVRAPAGDPVIDAAAPLAVSGGPRTRVVRAAATSSDSGWAAEAGHVLVHWPRANGASQPTAEGVVARRVVLAAPLVRRALGNGQRGQVIARFADGTPAIVERAHGEGCIRDVAFDLPPSGDVPLRESTRRLVDILGAPCYANRPRFIVDPARLDSLRGRGPLLATSALARPSEQRSPATVWLLIAAALVLMIEMGVRQRAPKP
jgi:hypothetical protein